MGYDQDYRDPRYYRWYHRVMFRTLVRRCLARCGIERGAHLLDIGCGEGTVSDCFARRGLRVFFLGARAEVLERAVRNFRRQHPGLIVAGTHHGYFTRHEEPGVVRRINEARPDILFLAFGTPAKEYWMDRHRDDLAAFVQQPVGGSVDVAAGVTRRAPRWMQNAGLEWFWRILQEPGRMWKRYLVTNTVFLLMFAWSVTVGIFRTLLPRTGTQV